ncbi:TPA: SIMPL domain-containing protein [Salmonella enterica]|uniref:SIMPL domain-containing protein n=1 Tax=Salmonella enterica TaxID=28901 RepID=UPI0012CDBFE2|nr:SIMPL domain-containing protein [Salmonella enterica]EBL9890928.1 hypothetical protein [Salmonella enterica]MBO1522513.1 SIMPL domain-containing protein [Salmonella enterica subsp. enterica serovar Enteritidis]MCE5391472.1 SIMPL domain-containing protein [Salmonella enterica subsp. enterica serovar Typhi]MCE5407598.1 SIMPL domain-containing protein [Salmonella enterica subsp. enterica serovar Typhi]
MKFKVMALAALVGLSAMSAQASELPEGPHIVTSGTASVDAVPDIATLAIEVNVAAKDAATAKKQADERVAQPDAYKDKARKAAIDDAIHQAQALAAGFNSKLGPVYSVRYHVSNYQPSPVVRMMKAADAAPVSAQETYEQPTIQFDDQVDVVFQLEPGTGQTSTTAASTQ